MDINEIIKHLMAANPAYYNTGQPIMTDQEYDALVNTLKSKDPTHPFFSKVGSTPSDQWKKAEHKIFMGSLDKVTSDKEFQTWNNKHPNQKLILEPKLDGLSLSIRYENNMFVQAITRGDGTIGEDISPNVRQMKYFVEKINRIPFTGSIRSEIILLKKDLDRINSILLKKDQYKNCRNAASGISRRLDGKFCEYLLIISYDIDEPVSEYLKIDLLRRMNFKTVPIALGNLNKITDAFRELYDKREKMPYNIDGAVIKINDYDVQQSLGISNNRPKGQIAWKFDPPSAVTILDSVTWEVGRTGVITPLAHIEPVEIDGSTIQRATLHNIAEIKRLNVGLKDTVMIVKRGDIIPKIESVLEHRDNPIKIPVKCPTCDSDLENNGIQLFCRSNICPEKNFQRIMNFIKVTKIDNLGESLVDKLFKTGKVQFISSLFILQKEDIAEIEGWGEKSAEQIIKNINKAKKLNPVTFLASIGIPSISFKTAEDMINNFKTIEMIKSASIDSISDLKGYKKKSSTAIVNGIKEFSNEIDDLLKIIDVKSEKSDGKLAGLAFCFTGAMKKSRAYYQELVKQNGGKNNSSVIKTTNYLVCNENKGSSKSKKAEKYGTKIITEEEFLLLIDTKEQIKPKIVYNSLFDEE